VTSSRSNKVPVIDHLWDMLQAEGQGRRIVMFADVQTAIEHVNGLKKFKKPLSVKNPANFMKDIIRNDNASRNWPDRLCAMKIGGRQRVGQDRVLEFVDYVAGQSEPFPNRYVPTAEMIPIKIQSISLPLTSKILGRQDESWLIQVAVHLNLIEQHFALHDSMKVKEIVHLQVGVKLAGSEVDSLFRAVIERPDKSLGHALITCEAKQRNERVLEHQIVEQIVAACASVQRIEGFEVDYIIPIAIKAIPPEGQVYLVEFKAWTPEAAALPEDQLPELAVESEALYSLVPPVPGVGANPPKARKRKSGKAKAPAMSGSGSLL
jgi:hypothetical protein